MNFEDLPPCETEVDLLNRLLGIGVEKQTDFMEIVNERKWFLDFEQGVLGFEDSYTFPAQLIGTFSHTKQTWLWAWANPDSLITEQIVQDALFIQQYGEEHGFELLSNAEFDFEIDRLHIIGMIAIGLTDATGYYLANNGEVMMLLTVKGEVEEIVEKQQQDNVNRHLDIYQKILGTWDVNHLDVLHYYLLFKDYKVTEKQKGAGYDLIGQRNGGILVANFDENLRFVTLRAEGFAEI